MPPKSWTSKCRSPNTRRPVSLLRQTLPAASRPGFRWALFQLLFKLRCFTGYCSSESVICLPQEVDVCNVAQLCAYERSDRPAFFSMVGEGTFVDLCFYCFSLSVL